MEKITADTVNEMMSVNSDISLEGFVEVLKQRWIEHIENSYNREISVVVAEYKDLVKKIISNASKD